MLRLIGSPRSPFARVCRIFMLQNRIPFEFIALNFVEDTAAAKELAAHTPINKVPLLLDEDRKIFDSRIIIQYLMEKHGIPRLSLEDENRVSSAYSAMDSGVILFLMRKDGFDVNAPGFFLKRQRERIPDNLTFLSPWAEHLDPDNPTHWNHASMSLFSLLYWGEARELLNMNDFPALKKFYERFQEAPGVRETGF